MAQIQMMGVIMGYSYDGQGRLCCDVCGRSGGVRKIRCPFGWCPPAALCQECRSKYGSRLTRAYHRQMGCEADVAEARQRDAEQQALLDSGNYVRTSALAHNGRVKVVFRNAAGDRKAYWMAPGTYRSIPLMQPATPAHFSEYGKVTEAENADMYAS